MLKTIKKITEKQFKELSKELYDYAGLDIDCIDEHLERDFLSVCIGSDGKEYLWLLDDSLSIAIDVDGKIFDESYDSETLEGILW